MPSVTVPTPGIRNGYQSDQDSQHHAETKRYIAEFRRRFHGIAEVTPNLLFPVGGHQHTNPIAKLQRQIGGWDDVHVIAPDVQQVGRKAGRQRQLRERHPDHDWLC